MAEYSPTPEQSPNQPFHDLLLNFGADIIANLQAPNGIFGYPTELLHQYEQHVDQLLAARDQQLNRNEP